MDPRVLKLQSVESCEKFKANAIRLGEHELAKQATLRAVAIRAKDYRCETEAEKLAIEAVYAYEEVLTQRNGKRTRASRTWQMIERRGVIGAVERAVNREGVSLGYTALVEMGLEEFAFEAVILRFPELFSNEAVQKSQERMSIWQRT
ncbi:TPA: hypothetical protein NKZ49_003265 [Vibrio parahaemolyticus]|nr:hypothetical protein [Vibrio parahaemolyticus]HCH5629475.1 hypothetical protein [Vibrio parahaemolyticus]HCH5754373.1 hypothetical protein [Vibrio parahaemolyticus]HCM1522748.1 hypothetical protein [Vibrio parahaemolyticus]HCM1533351.1 hypothetical protein [Vibrio parahaemolyticus]